MRTFTISLGGREFELRQLPIGAEQSWRADNAGMMDAIGVALGLVEKDINSPADVAEAIRMAAAVADGGALLEALIGYDPALAADREWLLENAYSDEVSDAVLSLFFGGQRRRKAKQPVLSNGAVG